MKIDNLNFGIFSNLRKDKISFAPPDVARASFKNMSCSSRPINKMSKAKFIMLKTNLCISRTNLIAVFYPIPLRQELITNQNEIKSFVKNRLNELGVEKIVLETNVARPLLELSDVINTISFDFKNSDISISYNPQVKSGIDSIAKMNEFLNKVDTKFVKLCLDIKELKNMEINPISFINENLDLIDFLRIEDPLEEQEIIELINSNYNGEIVINAGEDYKKIGRFLKEIKINYE